MREKQQLFFNQANCATRFLHGPVQFHRKKHSAPLWYDPVELSRHRGVQARFGQKTKPDSFQGHPDEEKEVGPEELGRI
jgi:hypothetical protein